MLNHFDVFITNFHFMRPWWLLSIVPIYFFYRSVVAKDDLIEQWRGHMSEKLINHLSMANKSTLNTSPKLLFLVFSIIATIVMAGPSWKQKTSPFFVNESALIIALDVSSSMNNSDIQPSRLLRAKQKINELIERRGNAKTGLVVFAGSAHVAMPVTQDKEMIRHFLDVLDNSLLPVQESAPHTVLAPAKLLLSQTKAPSTLLILSDKTSEHAISEFNQYFETQTHQALVWAIGENPDSGLANGTGLSSTTLDQLAKLANAGKGKIVPFTHNSDDIETINDAIATNMSAVTDSAQPWYDEGYLLLFLLLPLQALWFRRGWTMQW